MPPRTLILIIEVRDMGNALQQGLRSKVETPLKLDFGSHAVL